MADDKSKTSEADRKQVAADQGYEVSYFARKHGLSAKDARTLIERFGNDRSKLNAEASKLAKNTGSSRRTKRARSAPTEGRDPQTNSGRTARAKRTGVVAKAAALSGVVAAGAFAWSRRKQLADQISKFSDALSGRDQEGSDGAQRTNARGASASRTMGSGRSQVEIAQEALTLKQAGETTRV